MIKVKCIAATTNMDTGNGDAFTLDNLLQLKEQINNRDIKIPIMLGFGVGNGCIGKVLYSVVTNKELTITCKVEPLKYIDQKYIVPAFTILAYGEEKDSFPIKDLELSIFGTTSKPSDVSVTLPKEIE